MKKSFCLLSIMLHLLVGATQLMAEPESDLWREMSARVQNLHYRILIYGPSVGLDYSAHEEDLKGVDEALEALVSAGELESKSVKLRSPGELGDEKIDELFPMVEKVASKYGIFIASEMCDLGARMRFMNLERDQLLQLHLRLPKDELDRVIRHLADLKLTVQDSD